MALIAISLTILCFSSCSGNNSSGSTEMSITAGEEVSEETGDTGNASDEEAEDSAIESEFAEDVEMEEETDLDLDLYFPDIPDKTDVQTSEEELTEEEIIDEDTSENPLMPVVDKVLSESEWPAMEEVTDPVIISDFFTLDPENANYRELIIMQCPMSASMSEIIIIDADDTESAKADLEARQTKAIETDAWYPHDQELAAASIVGTNGSYAYFIIGDNAAAAEESINDYFNNN